MNDCVFCDLIADNKTTPGPTTVTQIIEPLNPVTEGHLLVVPRVHVDDFTTNPDLSGLVMRDAAEMAEYMRREHGVDVNVITSIGSLATQTVFHLHAHLVPRRSGDGLALPWTNQQVEQQDDFATAVQIAKLADGKPDHSTPPVREEWMSPDEYCPHGRKHSKGCADCEASWSPGPWAVSYGPGAQPSKIIIEEKP